MDGGPPNAVGDSLKRLGLYAKLFRGELKAEDVEEYRNSKKG